MHPSFPLVQPAGFRFTPIRARGFFRTCGLLAALAAMVLPRTSSAREFVVASTGGDFSTVAAGVAAAQPGDTVDVRAGIYHEAVSFGRSGSATAGFITLRGELGAVLDGAGRIGAFGITISSQSYIRVVGMTVQDFMGGDTPIGISVDGSSSYIEIRNNLVQDIENPTGNAHGIAFYGTAATPMTNIVVAGNEVRNCLLGSSESLVLNGNIDGFVVSGNTVHANDNIGIDFIGFEGIGPVGQDQVRNGSCVGNVVYDISSATNPAYGGDRSADGIYVDGGRDIVIERNQVASCDIGVEVACEHGGQATSNVTVRDNFISHGYQGNILMGGYDSKRGSADNIVVVNNTTCQATYGEVQLQYYCNGITIKNNILYASAGQPYITVTGGSNTNVAVERNVYYGASVTSPGPYPDALAGFSNPLLVSPGADLHLLAGSPAIDAGIDLGVDAQGQPISGSLDKDGNPRVRGSSIDVGAQEFASAPAGVPLKMQPSPFSLATTSPNPVYSVARIRFSLAIADVVTLAVYDCVGRAMASPLDRVPVGAGAHEVELDTRGWPPGGYYCRLLAGRAVLTRKMVVVH